MERERGVGKPYRAPFLQVASTRRPGRDLRFTGLCAAEEPFGNHLDNSSVNLLAFGIRRRIRRNHGRRVPVQPLAAALLDLAALGEPSVDKE